MTIEELKAQLDKLSPVKLQFVSKVIHSLSNTPQPTIRQHGTWLTGSPDWIEYFGLALSVHHAATSEPLGLTAFETVFRNACEQMDWQLDPPGSPTRRFVDLIVDTGSDSPLRLSLKSTAARNLSRTKLIISKLTEASWIQDARTSSFRRQKTLELFQEYKQEVDSIIMLRAFRGIDGVPNCYQLVEIPVTLFDPVQRTPLKVFERDAPVIDCFENNQLVAKVAIDRSDAKITIRSIDITACVVHAEWRRN